MSDREEYEISKLPCTHKHCDERLAQVGPCPYHEALGKRKPKK